MNPPNDPGTSVQRRPLRSPQPTSVRRSSDIAESRVPGTSELGTILALIVRQKWPILITFMLIMGATVGYTLFKPPVYESTLRLRLSGNSEQDLKNIEWNVAEVELLKSRGVLEQVARESGLVPKGASPRDAAKIMEALEEGAKATALTGTNLIELRYKDRDAKQAAKILNLWAATYMKKHDQLNQRPETAQLYEERRKQAENHWRQSREEVDALRAESQTPMIAEQRQTVARRRADLEAGLEEVRVQLSESRERLEAVKAQLNSQPAAVESAKRVASSSGLADTLKSQLLSLETQRAELLTRYDPSYRSVKQIDQQIASARQALEKEQVQRVVERTESLNPMHQSLIADKLKLEASLAGLKARFSGLQSAVERIESKTFRIDDYSQKIEEAERRAKLAEDEYQLFLKRQQEAEATDLSNKVAGIRAMVLEPAVEPIAPVRNHRGFVLALGLLAACFCSAAVSIAVDYLRLAIPHAINAARIVQSAPVRVPLATPAHAIAVRRAQGLSPKPAMVRDYSQPVDPDPNQPVSAPESKERVS